MHRVLVIAGGLVAMAAASAPAARPHTPSKRPDFTGLWSTASLTNLERPEDLKTLSLTQAQAFSKARRAKRKAAADNPEDRDPSERCVATDGAGPPLANGGINDNFEMVQTGDDLAIHAEWMSSLRVVHIGKAQHLPPEVRLASGDSIARWEGDVLLIETTNFSAQDVDSPRGDARADMRTVERLSRISPTALLYSFSVTNPAVFSQTWQGEMIINAAKGPLYEYACHEGNYGLTNILAGARYSDAHPAAVSPPTKPAGK